MTREPRPTAAIEVRAQAACFDRDVLLCARHARGGETYWVLPGGHVEGGETLEKALGRELVEETGLVVEAAALWALSEFVAAGRHVLDCTFLVTRWGGEAALGGDPEAGGGATLVDLAWLDRAGFADARFRPVILGRRLLDRWADATAPAAYLGVERA